MLTCEFVQIDEHHVKCPLCGKMLSGTPERYADKIFCKEKGLGSEFSRELQKWANLFGIKFKKCRRCRDLELQMNINDHEWLEQYREEIVTAVQNNAKHQGILVPKLIIRKMLKKAERRLEDAQSDS